MLPIFANLRDLFFKSKSDKAIIDSPIFRLHSVYTTLLLLAFSLILTGRQFVGDPIDCVTSRPVPANIINTYCWIHSTYIMPEDVSKRVGTDVIYPGIPAGFSKSQKEATPKFFTYYQWVCLVLFIQAICFYAPRHLWINWEGGLVETLKKDFKLQAAFEMGPEGRKRSREKLVQYFRESRGRHRMYAIRYFLCKLLCLANTLCQVYLTNQFLNGDFYTYGYEVVNYLSVQKRLPMNPIDPALSKNNPILSIFPKMTRCLFHDFGPSGEIQRVDAYCILPLNIVNEKIFLVLWFWYIILAILQIISLIFHLLVTFVPPIRSFYAPTRLGLHLKDAAMKEKIAFYFEKSSFGDCFLLTMLSKNISDPVMLEKVLCELCDYWKKPDKSYEASV